MQVVSGRYRGRDVVMSADMEVDWSHAGGYRQVWR